MIENKEKDSFSYTYSAKEQEEIKKIRQKYQPKEPDNMEKLRSLDASVNKKATMVSIAYGVFGALVLGFGMSIIMSEFGNIINISSALQLPVGIVIGVAGMVLIAMAYPVYVRTIKKEREKVAPEILRLTEELMR